MFPKLCTTELLDIYICCQKFRLLLCQAALYQAWSEHFPTLFISSVTQAMRSSSSLMLSSCCEILFCMALWKSKDSNQLDQVHGSYHRMGCTQLVIIQRLHWLWMICVSWYTTLRILCQKYQKMLTSEPILELAHKAKMTQHLEFIVVVLTI